MKTHQNRLAALFDAMDNAAAAGLDSSAVAASLAAPLLIAPTEGTSPLSPPTDGDSWWDANRPVAAKGKAEEGEEEIADDDEDDDDDEAEEEEDEDLDDDEEDEDDDDEEEEEEDEFGEDDEEDDDDDDFEDEEFEEDADE